MKKKVVTKKEFLGEYEAIRNAFAKVNIREAVAPIVRGKIVEDVDTYNKVQQLLDTPDMEHAHKFLLDIDFDEITPETKQKVDDLYQLAVSQGYIAKNDESDNEEEVPDEESDEQPEVSDNSGGFEDVEVPDSADAAKKDSIGMNAPVMNTPAYIVFYSAMKDGEIRSGECYSNATTVENAKLDATQKLQKLGFTAIEILASEMADPGSRGSSDVVSSFGASVNDNDGEEKEETDEPIVETEDKEETDKEDSEKEDSENEEETQEEPEEKELSRSEKLDYFKRYLEEFKALLKKMKAETYADMPLADRAKFYDRMTKIWADKPDPSEFMSDDNVKQIEHMKIKLD